MRHIILIAATLLSFPFGKNLRNKDFLHITLIINICQAFVQFVEIDFYGCCPYLFFKQLSISLWTSRITVQLWIRLSLSKSLRAKILDNCVICSCMYLWGVAVLELDSHPHHNNGPAPRTLRWYTDLSNRS